MKIKISPQDNSSITEEIELELGDYTILAGENNSGKTNLINAIREHDDLKGYKKIYVPAEHINPKDDETKSSAARTEFYKLLQEILEPIFEKKILDNLLSKFDKSASKKTFIDGINKLLSELDIKDKKFDVKLSKDEFKDEIIIKNFIKAFVKDLYQTDIKEVDFDKIGMGTKRLIVAVLIRYYEEKKIGKDDNTLVIFEEPEVYLHPKWKSSLYKSLLSLSQRKNTKVLITTHDPYFIELGKSQKIYRVYRDSGNKDATALELKGGDERILDYISHGEINYSIFEVPTEAYYLEVYEHCKRKTGKEDDSYLKFDKHIFDTHFKLKGLDQDCKDDDNKDVMGLTRLRHDIAHGKETNIDLKTSLDLILGLVESITT